ncbi:hypothetical protein [Moorena producens]|uniref:hypothetical protein n=1 Tax=Moorena producens TaxID=1155739 RepID=UPI003C7884E1
MINRKVGSAYQADPIQINQSAPLPTLHLFSNGQDAHSTKRDVPLEPLRERNQINPMVGSATKRDVPLEPLRERNQINPMVGSATECDVPLEPLRERNQINPMVGSATECDVPLEPLRERNQINPMVDSANKCDVPLEPLRERNQINQSAPLPILQVLERARCPFYRCSNGQDAHSTGARTGKMPILQVLERNQINPMVGSAYQADPIQINHSAPLPTLHLFCPRQQSKERARCPFHARCPFYRCDSRFPIPDSRFPIPDSLLPTPYSLISYASSKD